MWELHNQRAGGIIGDKMGLGGFNAFEFMVVRASILCRDQVDVGAAQSAGRGHHRG